MKHDTVAIFGQDLLYAILQHTDTPWRDVICWNCHELDQLEAIDEPSLDQEKKIDILDRKCGEEAASIWWIVSWPNHVVTPRFNCDANYAHGREAMIKNEADRVFNE